MAKTSNTGNDFWYSILEHIEPFDESTCSRQMLSVFLEMHPGFLKKFFKQLSLPENRQWKEDVEKNGKVFCILNMNRISRNFCPKEDEVKLSKVGDFPAITLNYNHINPF